MRDEQQPLAVELLNTLGDERYGEPGSAADERGLRAWLDGIEGRELDKDDAALFRSIPADGKELDLAGLRRLRDALRAVAARVAGATPTIAAAPDIGAGEALRVLNEIAGSARWWFELAWPGEAAGDSSSALVRRCSATGPAALLGRLAEDGVQVFSGELLACVAPACWRYFVRSDPRRQWCSTVCGNRARVARHYARQQAARHAEAPVLGL
ncbi:MAG TPA: CGNR zinc finger domain-containing protein [Pseudonocardia sp.]|nr:CGNR zinc finger domain-containing protein [Pseudonocardia sp.]